MSTRCNIIVKDSTGAIHYVYHHCDGYLEGVGEELRAFSWYFINSDFYSSAETFCKELEKWDNSYEFEDYGVHEDIDYLYTVNIDCANITLSAERVVLHKNSGKWKATWIALPEYTKTFTKGISPNMSSGSKLAFEEEFSIIGWPEIQAYMDEDGFEENSSLINQNNNIGIGDSTYLISKEWLNSL